MTSRNSSSSGTNWTPIDTDSIKRSNPLEQVVENDLGQPMARSGGSKSIVKWLCPFHPDDATPSLAVYCNTRTFYCFGCTASGDVIGWVMRRHNLNFADACATLGWVQDGSREATQKKSAAVAQPVHAPTRLTGSAHLLSVPSQPDDDWQTRAWQALTECEQNLWYAPEATLIRDYLERRGLGDEIVSEHFIGYNPADQVLYGHFVPKGITIPIWHESRNTLYGIKVRRSPIERESSGPIGPQRTPPKYVNITGSAQAPLGLDNIRAVSQVYVCEGEFDYMLVLQTLRGLGLEKTAGAMTLGSASTRSITQWVPYMMGPRRFLIVTDADAAGDKAAAYWLSATGRAQRLSVPNIYPMDKDITDLYVTGGLSALEDWLKAGLSNSPPNA